MNRPPMITKPRENTGLGMLLLGGLGALGIGVVLFLFDPAAHGFYPRCQFHAWTGLYCPGCGSLRALHQLAHGHLGVAFGLNPLLVMLLPFLLWAMGSKLLRPGGERSFSRLASPDLPACPHNPCGIDMHPLTPSLSPSDGERDGVRGIPIDSRSFHALEIPKFFDNSRWFRLMLAVVLGFTVLRNIPVAPFTWLAP